MKYFIGALEFLGRAEYDEAYRDSGEERLFPIYDELTEMFKASYVKAEIVDEFSFGEDMDSLPLLSLCFQDSKIVKMEIFYKKTEKPYNQKMTLLVKPSYDSFRVSVIEDNANKSGRADVLRNYQRGLELFKVWAKKGCRY